MTKEYPDNSEIFAAKQAGRKSRAKASFAEKLAALDALRARVAPLVRERERKKLDRSSRQRSST